MKIKLKNFYKYGIVVLVITLVVVYFILPRAIVQIKLPFSKVSKENYIPKNDTFSTQVFTFKSFDGNTMEAYKMPAKSDTVKGTVIMLHGIRADKMLFYKQSQYLAAIGYNTVSLDLRGHGNSGGKYCTFGVKEKKDVQKLIDTLEQFTWTENLGIWGFSLGGAVALQTMAEDKRIQYGIIESTFNSMPQITHDYTQRILGFDWKPFTDFMIMRAGQIADFNTNDAAPLKACPQIIQPIFMAHGNKDKRIAWQKGKRNFEALQSKEKTFLLVEDAIHTTLWRSKKRDYQSKVFQFLEKQKLLKEPN